ncbi:hypothetical protein [Streptomyces sp. cg35]|uniref:hypothetical protein n=1 Tax=Streptomyces sp. cg35 TaxID=3421650 RepID=UPI003D187464
MIEQSITIDGTETALTATSAVTWTASDIALRLRPNMTWRATRGDITGDGDTAQAATDSLIAAECKAAKVMQLAARSTKGQNFAREMRSYLQIGPRTRRFNSKKWAVDGHRDVINLIAEASYNPGMYNADREAIFRTAFAALRSWEKHIDGYRTDVNLVAHINAMTPYQFVAFLADMIDAGITNVGEGERYFAEMARRLYAQAA